MSTRVVFELPSLHMVHFTALHHCLPALLFANLTPCVRTRVCVCGWVRVCVCIVCMSWVPRGSDHIALIMELLGKVPRKVVAAGKYSREFFSKKGNSTVAFMKATEGRIHPHKPCSKHGGILEGRSSPSSVNADLSRNP